MSKLPVRYKENEVGDHVKVFHGNIPLEVVELIKLLKSSILEDILVQQLINLAILYIEKNSTFDSEFRNIIMGIDESQRCCAESVFTGLYILIQEIIRRKFFLETLKTDLAVLEVPEAIAVQLLHSIHNAREGLEQKASADAIGVPKLSGMRWRVDVVLSSSAVSRVMRPSVLMRIVLDDGSVRTFEVPLAQFHQLRHGVAKTLAEMQRLERHPIVRIVEELEKRDIEERNRLR